MSNQKTSKTEEIVVPEKIQTFQDKRTKTQTVAFPIEYPDGFKGLVMLSRLPRWKIGGEGRWEVGKAINKIVIHYAD